MPALVLTAWGLAGIGTDLGILTGDGWTLLLVGLAFLAGWALGRFQRVRRDWALVLGAIFGIIGLADVSDALNLDLDIAVLVPLAMIGVGVYLIAARPPAAAPERRPERLTGARAVGPQGALSRCSGPPGRAPRG